MGQDCVCRQLNSRQTRQSAWAPGLSRRFGIAAIVIFAAVSALVLPARLSADSWYSGSWKYRQKIDVSSYALTGNLSSFPLLVKLTAGNPVFSKAKTNGVDILFTSSDAVTKIPHEIEKYDSVGQELDAWVKVPTLNGSATTTIYMYYGNPGAPDQQNATAVWDSNDQIVMHLGEQATAGQDTAIFYDSTVNSSNGAQQGTGSAAGKIAGGQTFNGVTFAGTGGDLVNIDNVPTDTWSSLTVGAWFNLTGANSTSSIQRLFSKANGTGVGAAVLALIIDPNAWSGHFTTRVVMNTPVTQYDDNPGTGFTGDITTGTWHYFVATWSSSAGIIIYLDGSPVPGGALATSGATLAPSASDQNVVLGNDEVSQTDRTFKGTMDEVRLSDTVRSPDWIKASYTNQNNPTGFQTTTEQVFISGRVYTDEGVTPIAAGKTIALSINGGTTAGTSLFTTTTDSSGAYGITVPTANLSAGNRLLAYIQGDVTYKAATVTTSDGKNLSGLDLYASEVIVRNDNGGSPTVTDMTTANNSTADVTVLYAKATGNIATGYALYVPVGTTFAPGASLNIGSAGTTSTARVFGTLNASATFHVFGSVSGAGTLNGGAATVTIDGSLTLGTYSATSGTTTVGANFAPTSFTPSTGMVTFNGTGTVGTYTFYGLTVNGGTRTATGNLTVSNSLTLTSGTFAPGSGTHQVAGNWNDTGVTFTPSAGTVVLTGSNPAIAQGATNNFRSLTIQNGATLLSNLVVNGDLAIQGGTLDAHAGPSYNITLGGNWSNLVGATGFSAQAGTVTINNASLTTTFSGATSFSNFTCSTMGKTLVFAAGSTQTVTGTLTLTQINLRSSVPGSAWSLNVQSANPTVSYVYPQNSIASGNTITATNSIDDGSNVNWNITQNTMTSWTGANGTDWSTAGNWSPVGTPGAGSNVVIPSGLANYPIIASGSNVTVTTLTIAANASLTLSGTAAVSAGLFSNYGVLYRGTAATSTACSTSGTVVYNGTGGAIANQAYYNLTIDSVGQTFTLGGALTVSGTLRVIAGTLAATGQNTTTGGDLIVDSAGAFTAGTSVSIGGAVSGDGVVNGAGSSFTVGGSFSPAIYSGSTGTTTVAGSWGPTLYSHNNGTVTLTGTGTVGASSFSTLNVNGTCGAAGNIAANTLVIAGSLSMGASNLTVSGALSGAGTLNGGTGTVSVTGAFGVSNYVATSASTYAAAAWNVAGVFTPGTGTVVFNGTSTLAAAESFNNLTIAAGASLDTVGNSLTITGVFSNGGTLYRKGGDYVSQTDPASGTVQYRVTGGAIQTYAGTSYNNLAINTAGQTYTLTGVTTVAGSVTILAGTLDVTTSNYRIEVGGNWSNAGTFTGHGGVVRFQDATQVSLISGNTTFNTLRCFAPGKTLQFATGTTQTVAGLIEILGTPTSPIVLTGSGGWAVTRGTANVSCATISNSTISPGTTAYQSTNGGSNTGWTFTGTVYTWSGTTTSWTTASNWTPNTGLSPSTNDSVIIPAGASAYPLLTFARTVQDLIIQSGGTLDVAGNTLTINGTFTNAGTLRRNPMTTATGNQVNQNDVSSGGTVVYYGANTYVQDYGSVDYANLTLDAASPPSITLNYNLGLTGSLTIGAGATLNASGSPITLGGSWTKNGTFTSGSNSVYFLDETQTSVISGTNTFYNLTCVVPGKTLQFAALTTQTIAAGGVLTITGSPGQPVTLARSGGSGTNQWFVTKSGTASVSYAAISNSNISFSTAAGNSVDDGNNTNWTFSPGAGYYTWRSTAASTAWNNQANWNNGSSGYPQLATDTVTIPVTTGNYPALDIARSMANLTIQSGASLDTAGNALTVTGNFVNQGTLYRRGGDSVNVTDRTEGTTWYRSAGGGVQEYGTGDDYYDLVLDGAFTFTPASSLSAARDLTITNGATLLPGSSAVSVGRNLAGTGAFSGGSGLVTVGGALSVGSFTASSNGTTVAGGFTPTTFTHNSGTVTLTGTGALGSGGVPLAFNNLTLNAPAGTGTLGGAISVAGNLTITAGTLDVSAGNNYGITVGGNWTNLGTFTARNGTVSFTDASKASSISGNTVFFNLSCTTAGKSLQVAAGSTQTVNGALTLTGQTGSLIALQSSAVWNLTLANVQSVSFVNASYSNASKAVTAAFSVNGGNNTNWTFASTSYTWTGGTTAWGLTTNWSPNGVPGGSDSVTIPQVASGNYPLFAGNTAVTNLTIQTNASLDTGGFNLTISSSFSNAGTLYRQGGDTVSLSDTAKGTTVYRTRNGAIQTYGGSDYYRLRIDSNALSLSTNLVVSENLLIAGGSLSAGSNQVSVGGLWNVATSGAFTAGTGTVVFNGAGAQSISAGGVDANHAFNNLTINKSAGSATLGSAMQVGGNLAIQAGTLDTAAGGNYSIGVGGNWTKAGSFLPRTGTVTFTGAAPALSGTVDFFNLSYKVAGGTMTFESGKTFGVAGAFVVTGAPGNLITLQSSAASPWLLNNTGSTSVSYARVLWSTASVTVTPLNSQDGGNNVNWNFVPPTMTARETADLDGNGLIDAIHITFSKPVKDSSVTASNFDVAGVTGEGFSSTTAGDTLDDSDIYITFTESASLKTDATPTITYTAGTLTDLNGNFMASTAALATTDKAAPVISATAPATNAHVNTAKVSYTLSEGLASGSITWTRTGGSADASSPHVQGLAVAELATGAHTNITLSSPPILVDGAIYTVSFNGTDPAGNAAAAVSDTTVTYDVTTPTLTPVTIVSNNANTTLAKTGNIITVSFTASETLIGLPTATIRGQAATVTNVGGLNYTATYTMLITDTEGLVPFTLNFTDAAGNAGTQVTATTNASSVTFDRTPPTLPTVTIASNNANTALAKTGDTITVSFTASETLIGLPTATIRGQAATVANVGGLNYTATYTMQGTDTEGVVPFTVNFTDAAGNAGTQVTATTNASSVTFDRTPPTLPTVTIASNNANTTLAKTGDVVTVAFTASETLIGLPTATIRGQAATVANVGGLNFTATYTMLITDTEGLVPFTVNFTDAAGNAGTQVTATTNASSVTFDRTVPTLPTVTIASNNANTALAKTGDTITVSFTASEILIGLPTATIRGQAATVANVGGLNYTAAYTMLITDTEGIVPFTVNFIDAASNAGTQVTATTNASSVTFDRTPPTLPTVTIASNNANAALARTGNIITVSFTASETLIGLPTATIRGQAATVTNVGGLNYTATYTMLITDAEGVVPFTVNFTDAAGNAGTQVTATTNASSVTFDRTVPTLPTVTIASNNANTALAKTGNIVTVSFTASETLIGLPTATIRGQAATVANVGGLNYTATYTMLITDTEGIVPFTVNFTDAAGNAGTQVTATTNASSVTFDRTPPTLPSVTIASNNANTALAKTGNIVTVSFTASETLLVLPTATIRGQAATVTNVGGLNYTATYTMQGTDTEGVVPFTVNFTDAAGNAGTQVTSTTNASSVTFDRTPPTLPTVAIASNNANTALAKTGNVVTVSFTASETLLGLPTATIRGQAATVTNVGGLAYTATYTMLITDTEGVVPFTVDFTDAAGNVGTQVTATTNASTVTFDRTPPTLPTVTIASNNANAALAKTGNIITVSFTASETLIGMPTATIRGQAATVANVGGLNYTATYTMLITDTEGLVPFTVNFTDAAGNAGTQVTATTNASSVTFDRTAPTLPTVTIASNNANAALAKTGNIVTVSFTASETLIGLPTATIRGQAATVANVGGLNYTATYTMLITDTEGVIPFTINFTDAAGNAGTAVTATTNASSVTFDRTAPTLPTVTIASNNANTALAKTGDTVTVSFTASETLLGLPTATIRGQAATVTNVGGLAYTATYTMLITDTEGIVPFTVNFTDAAGNAGAQVTATTNASSVTFDRTSPTLPTVTIASNNANTALAKTGNIMTVSFTASETLLLAQTTATIDGQAATVANAGGLNYTATYTMLITDTEGAVPFAVNFKDLAGNAGTQVTATTNASSVTFDRTPPTLPTVTIASNNANTALAKTGNIVTVSFTASELLIGLPSATIRGQAAIVTNVGGLNYTATYTMLITDTEGLVPFTVNFTDAAGNAGTQVTATTNATSVTFDRTPPTLPTVTIASNNANTAFARTGDSVTVSFTASETLLSLPTATIRGQAATVANVGGLAYTATYTMLITDTEGVVPFTVNFTDAAGNAGTQVAATTNASSVTFDRTPPTLPTVTIASNNANTALAKTGNVLTVSFTASETLLLAQTTATIDGQAATVANVGGLNYTATYTMLITDTEGAVPFAVNFKDLAGNAGTQVTATTNASSVTFDRTPPTLPTVTIASNNANTALAKTGDTVTVSFTASETLIALPTATIRGQAATVANVGGLNYTATYTMLITDTEGIVPFTVNFTDVAGNAGTQVTTTTNASSVTFDRTAPTLPTVTIASNNANTALAKTGNVVTVSFTASETLLGIPTATIRGQAATVTNVGGLNYTATYTMLITDTEGPVPFTVNFTDAAGNAGTQVAATTNASSVTFDRTPPTLPTVTIASNNANTALAKTGNVVTVSFTASETLIGFPTATIRGQAATVANVGGLNYTATYTMQGTDTEGLVPFALNFTDAAGNAGTQVTATTNASSVTFDRTLPTLPTVTIASNNANTALTKTGDTLTVSFTAGETLLGLPTATIRGQAATVTNVGGLNYTATRTMLITDTEGPVPFTVNFTDAAGNAGTQVTATTNASSVTFDRTPPTLPTVTIASNNVNTAFARTGDTVTVSFTASETLLGLPTATIRGQAATVTNLGGLNYTATYTMLITDTEGVVPFTLNFTDAAGNAGTQVTATTNASSVTFDRTPPTLPTVTVVSNNLNAALARTGDTVTLSFTASETLSLAQTTATLDGQSATVAHIAGLNYTATYTMQGTDVQGAVPFTINFKDMAGNAGTQVSATTNASSVTFDRTPPTLPTVTIASNNANTVLARTGDTVTVSFTASETLLGLPTATIRGQAATVTNVGGLNYTATYTLQGTDAEGLVPFAIDFKDAAGNSGTQTTATTNGSSVTFDRTPPTLPTVSIASNNAHTAFARTGDTVTVSFTASETLLLAQTTATILGQAAAVANVSGLNYTATYTMQGTDAEGLVPFAIDFKDAAGNAGTQATATTDASSVTFDRTAPTIAGHTLGAGNAYVDVQMSEGVYTTVAGGPLGLGDLTLIFLQNGGNATGCVITSLSRNDNSALSGGESIIRVHLSTTGVSNGLETIEVRPANANAVFDTAGNPMAASETTGSFNLVATGLLIQSRETIDSDGDGFIDQIRITTQQTLNDNFSGLSVLVAGHTVLSYGTGSTAGDTVFVVNLARGPTFDTGDTPVVRVASGGSLKSASGLYVMEDEPIGVAATDTAAPVLGITLAAVGGSRMYLEFSEPVFTDALGTTAIGAADFTYAGTGNGITGITPIDSVGPGMRKAFFNLAIPLTGDNVVADTIAPVNGAAVYDATGLALAATVRPISLLGLGVVEPVWATDGLSTGTTAGGPAALKSFDGSGRLMDGDIRLETSIQASSLVVNLVDLYLDSNVPGALKTGGLWLPSPATFPGLVNQSDPNAEKILQATASGALRDFSIPATDANIAAGHTVEFIPGVRIGLNVLYCMGVTDVNDPRTVRPYSLRIEDIQRQRGGATILNNVIHPSAGEKATFVYTLTSAGRVTIQVFTIDGNIVNVLGSATEAAGEHRVTWDGRNRAGQVVARGIYFIRAVGPDFDEIRKVLVVR